MQSTTKPWSPVPSGTERVYDQGGGSGQLAGGAKNLWVKKSRRKRVSRLKIATYNLRTLLRYEHVQELEEELGGLRQTEHTKRPPTIYNSKANNGQAGVCFLINRKRKVWVNSISPGVAELVLFITKRYKLKIVQLYASTTSYSDEDTNSFYNNVDETIAKPNHYTIVMGDFNAQMRKRKKIPMEKGNGLIWARIKKRKRRHLGRMGNIKKIHLEYHVSEESRNTMFQKKAGRRCTWNKQCDESENQGYYVYLDLDLTRFNKIAT